MNHKPARPCRPSLHPAAALRAQACAAACGVPAPERPPYRAVPHSIL